MSEQKCCECHTTDELSHENGRWWCRVCAVGELTRLRKDVDNRRMPDGDYWKCPLCSQYLDVDGSCPEECGAVGVWLGNYHKAQSILDDNDRLQSELTRLRNALPKCWGLNEQGEQVRDVVVVPDMQVYVRLLHIAGHPVLCARVMSVGLGIELRVKPDLYPECRVSAFDCSNSREAAEAAREVPDAS